MLARYQDLQEFLRRLPVWLNRAAAILGIAILAANGILVARALWGETWRPSGTYFEMDRHLRENPDTCAVVTVRFPMASLLLPHHEGEFPSPPMGDLLIGRNQTAFRDARHGFFWWLERRPACTADQAVLFHIFKPDRTWVEQGCVLQASGILKYLPEEKWDWAIRRNLASGPWYRCPANILRQFTQQTVNHNLARRFIELQNLPPFGITGEALVELGKRNTPPPNTLTPLVQRPNNE
jgi:hypothetical protein